MKVTSSKDKVESGDDSLAPTFYFHLATLYYRDGRRGRKQLEQ